MRDTASVAFAVPTIVLTDLWQMWKFTENALATVIISSGAALFAGKLRNGNTPIVAAAVMGSIFNYVDFLTNPPWQPMLIAFVVVCAGRSLIEAVKYVWCGWRATPAPGPRNGS